MTKIKITLLIITFQLYELQLEFTEIKVAIVKF